MKHTRKFIAGIIAVPIIVVTLALGALSWNGPDAEASGAACTGGVRATPATFEVFNREVGNYGSPGHVGSASIVAIPYLALPQPVFSPASLPNTGNASATVNYDIPADYEGTLKLNYRMYWSGSDGSDVKPGLDQEPAQVVLDIKKCTLPVTTTSTSTSTTSTSTTTSTTIPVTTTSTTMPTTSTTSTTMPVTTTSTTMPVTTTSTSTTTPSTTTTSSTIPETTTTSTTAPTTSTSTTQPSTTTTIPCEEPNVTVPGSPSACLAPPVVIEAPPAAPVPAAPAFTG